MSVLPLPESPEALARFQSARKPIALERARRAPFFKGKLDHIRADHLDEPEEWAKIPILDKEMLREIPEDRFFDAFCIADRSEIQEFWRSGGSTGRPLFYPRTFEDIRHAMAAFARAFDMVGAGADDVAHNSFPLGIHPAGHMYARASALHEVGMNWAGSGTGTPSAIQLQLLGVMKPSLWMGMPSYGLHLANLADAEGIDLAAGDVKTILTSAEPLSTAKRSKLERQWGATVYDSFGMTECSLMGCENRTRDGLVMWTDVGLIEVLDPATLEPVAEGEQGTLVTTSLVTNNATPFLRWNSGDIVSWHRQEGDAGPYGVFPLIRHAHRTAGFFKVRGVNINHSEFEDLMFAQPGVSEFLLEAASDGDKDLLRLKLELAGGADRDAESTRLSELVKTTFELTPSIELLPRGTIARAFEQTIKANRFSDTRS